MDKNGHRERGWNGRCSGADPTCTAILGMMGWAPILKAIRKEPELARRCSDLGLQWGIKLSQALIEEVRPDGMYISGFTGSFPLKGNDWAGEQLLELAKAVKASEPQVHLSFGYSDMRKVFNWHRERNLWQSYSVRNETLENRLLRKR